MPLSSAELDVRVGLKNLLDFRDVLGWEFKFFLQQYKKPIEDTDKPYGTFFKVKAKDPIMVAGSIQQSW